MIEVLERVAQAVTDAGLDTDLTVKYNFWTDADLKKAGGFIVYRIADDAGSNPELQGTDVLIQVVKKSNKTEEGDILMSSIIKLFRGVLSAADVVRFDPIGTINGPMKLDNNRRIWQLRIRCFTVDQ